MISSICLSLSLFLETDADTERHSDRKTRQIETLRRKGIEEERKRKKERDRKKDRA
jgi:hypothetical protein